MRRVLSTALGSGVFQAAHARLRTIVGEEDDDVLVNDIKQILGPHQMDKLPMILQLIFVEEQEAMGVVESL